MYTNKNTKIQQNQIQKMPTNTKLSKIQNIHQYNTKMQKTKTKYKNPQNAKNAKIKKYTNHTNIIKK